MPKTISPPRIGYARVSTDQQSLELQLDALANANCARIFQDVASGTSKERPELARALDHLRPGDQLVVWRLDRLGRSLRDLVRTIEELRERDVTFLSLSENLDTASAGGRLVFHVFASLAEFERDLIRERTHAGLAAARARGRVGGRPSVMTPSKTKVAKAMLAERDDEGREANTVQAVAETLGVSRASVYRALARERQ